MLHTSPDSDAVYNDLLHVLPALDTTDRALSLALLWSANTRSALL